MIVLLSLYSLDAGMEAAFLQKGLPSRDHHPAEGLPPLLCTRTEHLCPHCSSWIRRGSVELGLLPQIKSLFDLVDLLIDHIAARSWRILLLSRHRRPLDSLLAGGL